jgi:hypothetical protein
MSSTPVPGDRGRQQDLKWWLQLQFSELHKKIDAIAETQNQLKTMLVKKKSKKVTAVN